MSCPCHILPCTHQSGCISRLFRILGKFLALNFGRSRFSFEYPHGWIGHVKECGEETARFLSSSLLMAFNGCFLSEEEKERAIWNYLFSQESNLELLISHFPNRVNRAARQGRRQHMVRRETHKDPTFPPKLKLVLGPHSCPARWYVATFYCRPPMVVSKKTCWA